MNKKMAWVIVAGVLGIGILALWYIKPFQRLAVTKATPVVDRQLATVYDAMDPELLRKHTKAHQEAKRELQKFFPPLAADAVNPNEYYSAGFVHPERSGYEFSLSLDFIGAGSKILETLRLKKEPKFSQQALGDQEQFIAQEVEQRTGRLGIFSLIRIQNKQMEMLNIYFIIDEGKLRSSDDGALKAFLKLGDDEPEEAVARKIQLYFSEQAFDRLDSLVTFLSWSKFQIPVMPYGVDGLITLGVHGDLAPLKQGEMTPVAFVPQEGYRGVLKYMFIGQHIAELAMDSEVAKGAAQVFIGRHVQNTFNEPAASECRQSFVTAGSEDDFSTGYRFVQVSGFDVCMKHQAVSLWVRTAVKQIAKVAREVGDINVVAKELSRVSRVTIDSALLSGLQPTQATREEQAALREADAVVASPAAARGDVSGTAGVTRVDAGSAVPASPAPAASPSPASDVVASGSASTIEADFQEAMSIAFLTWFTDITGKLKRTYESCKSQITDENHEGYSTPCGTFRRTVKDFVARQLQASDFKAAATVQRSQTELTAHFSQLKDLWRARDQEVIDGMRALGWAIPLAVF